MKKSERPHLLLTNDDGIKAEGLSTLAEALEPHYDLTIVAPHRERSGAGHAITILRDLNLEKCQRNGKHWGWSFQGKPADCVKVAVRIIARDRPFDMVISGINRGQNLGFNILYSGTVAGAREGAILGIPSIAFSVLYHDIDSVRFDTGARVAIEVIQRVLNRGLPPGVLLNVNVPDVAYNQIKGHAVTRQGDSGYRDHFEHVDGHDGSMIYRNVGDRFYHSTDEDFDLDDRAVKDNRVSITPLLIDATAHHYLDDFQNLYGA